jgi:hypothetical protein
VNRVDDYLDNGRVVNSDICSASEKCGDRWLSERDHLGNTITLPSERIKSMGYIAALYAEDILQIWKGSVSDISYHENRLVQQSGTGDRTL